MPEEATVYGINSIVGIVFSIAFMLELCRFEILALLEQADWGVV